MRAEDLELHALLAVDADAGEVRFAGERALIVDAEAMGGLRRELVEALGMDGARAVLLRFGRAQGERAAEAMCGRFAWDSAEAVRDAGGRLGLIQGMLRLAPGTGPLAPGGATVPVSYEAEQHLRHCGPAEVPVCWTLAGFASGYLSRVEGREIAVTEDRCLARGDPACRFQAGPGPGVQEVAAEALPPEDDLQATRSPAMRRALELARRLAAVDSTVLIVGESGTGKDRVARQIHARSARAGAPFVALHCGAVAENLLESELFGHARGAFTGASRDRVGLLEAAGHGTLFLDEVGEMSAPMQVKLLRALQQREVRRIGENHTRPIHARVLAATHRDLAAAVAAGGFRRDLYYRLRVVELRVPPLRERVEDIVGLAGSLLAAAARRLGRGGMTLSERAAERLRRHAWPGNVRELENAMERAAALTTGHVVEADDLPEEVGGVVPVTESPVNLQALEHAAIVAALRRHDGVQSAAAAELGISASTLYRRLRRMRP